MKYVVVMRSPSGDTGVVYKAGRRTRGWTTTPSSAALYDNPYNAVRTALQVGGFAPVEVRTSDGDTVWASIESRQSKSGMILRDGAWVEWEGTNAKS